MHPLLEQLLKKRGIKDVTELTTAEKAEYDRWYKALIAEEITMRKLEEFLKDQKGKAENQIANPDNSKERDMFLKASLNIYRSLLGLIESPRVEKETVERHLKQLLGK